MNIAPIPIIEDMCPAKTLLPKPQPLMKAKGLLIIRQNLAFQFPDPDGVENMFQGQKPHGRARAGQGDVLTRIQVGKTHNTNRFISNFKDENRKRIIRKNFIQPFLMFIVCDGITSVHRLAYRRVVAPNKKHITILPSYRTKGEYFIGKSQRHAILTSAFFLWTRLLS